MGSARRAELFLVLCTFIWGGTFVAIDIALDSTPPFLLMLLRFAIASIVFLVFLGKRVVRAPGRVVLRGTILGAVLSLSFSLQTIGLQYTTVARSAFITQLLVLFTPIFFGIIRRRLPRWPTLVGIIIVLTGMYLLTSAGDRVSTAQIVPQWNRGDWLTLGCAAAFALYIVLIEVFAEREKALELTFFQTAGMLPALAIGMLVTGDLHFESGWVAWLSLLYLAIPGVNLVIYWQVRYQPDTTAPRAAVIYTLEPVFATVFAWLLLNQRPAALAYLGGAVIIVGILFSELVGARKDSDPGKPGQGV